MYIEKKIERNVLLKPFTTYQLGGPADYFIKATTQNELVESVRYAITKSIPYFVLGTGANILFGDKGFRGLVIKNEARNFKIEHWGHIICLIAETGAIISNIVEATVTNNYSGFEHFAGIPSTVGGALWQNLHFLSPDRKRTVFIEEIFAHGYAYSKSEDKIKLISKSEMDFSYDT
jgi:UDP-N-acetylmuramate dehydrogenase